MLARPAGYVAIRARGIDIARIAAVVALTFAVANCSSTRTTRRGTDAKYGVKPSPKVIPDGEPIPKGGGRAIIGKPYVVAGQTYVPSGGRGYDREGSASWYGAAFHGRLTANGEVFDRESIAAAHPTLPLPSYVRITNLANHRSMIVRVNDRGPYERSRLIDVSERVAEALEFHRRGTTQVRVEYAGKASTHGSDDAKLLATLRVDGTPAPFGRHRAPVMMADLGRTDPLPSPPRALPMERPEPPPHRERITATSTDEEPGVVDGEGGDVSSPVERIASRSPESSDASPDEPSDPSRSLPASARPDVPVVHSPPIRPVMAGIY